MLLGLAHALHLRSWRQGLFRVSLSFGRPGATLAQFREVYKSTYLIFGPGLPLACVRAPRSQQVSQLGYRRWVRPQCQLDPLYPLLDLDRLHSPPTGARVQSAGAAARRQCETYCSLGLRGCAATMPQGVNISADWGLTRPPVI